MHVSEVVLVDYCVVQDVSDVVLNLFRIIVQGSLVDHVVEQDTFDVFVSNMFLNLLPIVHGPLVSVSDKYVLKVVLDLHLMTLLGYFVDSVPVQDSVDFFVLNLLLDLFPIVCYVVVVLYIIDVCALNWFLQIPTIVLGFRVKQVVVKHAFEVFGFDELAQHLYFVFAPFESHLAKSVLSDFQYVPGLLLVKTLLENEMARGSGSAFRGLPRNPLIFLDVASAVSDVSKEILEHRSGVLSLGVSVCIVHALGVLFEIFDTSDVSGVTSDETWYLFLALFLSVLLAALPADVLESH